MDLTPPVDIEDHLEVLRIAEEEDDGRMTGDVSVTEGRDLVSGGRHGYPAQPRVRVAPQVPHPGPNLLARDVDGNSLPVPGVILQPTNVCLYLSR